jgi:hypothetical protein
MTSDDLKVQKGLAMVEVEDAQAAANSARVEYDSLVRAINEASTRLLEVPPPSSEDVLRSNLRPYQHIINVDLLVGAVNKLNTASRTLREAQQKLAVFRSR